MAAGNAITGKVLQARLSFIKSRGDEKKLNEVLERLPPEDRQVLKGTVLPILWYPMELCLRLDGAIADVFSPDDRSRVFVEMGRTSADVNLNGAEKVWLKPGRPHSFLRMAPQIYAYYYQVGRRTYDKVSETEAIIKTFDAESVTEADCLTVIGWHERALELCGARGIAITEPACVAKGADHCEYRMAWTSVAT